MILLANLAGGRAGAGIGPHRLTSASLHFPGALLAEASNKSQRRYANIFGRLVKRFTPEMQSSLYKAQIGQTSHHGDVP